MKQLFLFLFCTTLSLTIQAQSYSFHPKWKVGETKTVSTTFTKKKFLKDSLTSQETENEAYHLKVLGETDTHYTIVLKYENVVLEALKPMYDKLDKELEAYKELSFEYKIDKKTAEYELVNWQESNSFIEHSFNKVMEVFSKKTDEDTTFIKNMLKPYLELFKDKKSMADYLSSDILDLLIPYNNELVLHKTKVVSDSAANPFNPKQIISATTKTTLRSVDKQKSVCSIDVEFIPDLTAYKKMIQTMMLKFAEMAKVSDESKDKKIKEIEEIDINISQKQIYTFNYATSWLQKIEKTNIVFGTDPKKGKSKTISTATVLIK